MPIGAIAGLVGGALKARGASRAAGAQSDAANRDLDFQRRVYNEGIDRVDPFYQQGIQANKAYAFENGLAPRPEGYRGFDASRGQQYLRQQGIDAIQASAAAQGGLFSAATMGELGRANTDYANTFREQHLNRLAGMADTGLNAAGMQGTQGANAAAGASNAFGALGNAQSAGIIGRGNAITGGIENALAGFGYQRGIAGGNTAGKTGGGGIKGNGGWANGLFGKRGIGGFF